MITKLGIAAPVAPTKARNVVLVHGLFADGSSWSEVIARLQPAGLNVTAVQNPLTTLPDVVASAQRVLARQDGSAGVFDGDEGRLSEEAFLRDFAGDLPEAKAKVLYAVQEPFQKALLTGRTTHAAWRSKPSYYAVSRPSDGTGGDRLGFLTCPAQPIPLRIRCSRSATG